MVEYKRLFLDEIKSLFLYLVKFSEGKSMLIQKYPNDCAIDSLNLKLIIMIIYDEYTFSQMIFVKKYGLLMFRGFYKQNK